MVYGDMLKEQKLLLVLVQQLQCKMRTVFINYSYSLIALNVDKSLQVHISSTTAPCAAWETLWKQFECVSIAQIVRLNRRFYASTMKEGTDLMEHLTYMTSLVEQFCELKDEITPQKFATVILGSLPESYDNFISSLNARSLGHCRT